MASWRSRRTAASSPSTPSLNLVPNDTNAPVGHLRARPTATARTSGSTWDRAATQRQTASVDRCRSRRTGASSPSAPRATSLVPGDTNDVWDIFVRDRAPGTTERVSVASDGGQANGPAASARRSRPTGASWPSFRRHQPRPERHQWRDRRLRPRPPAGPDRAGEPRAGRRAGRRQRLPAGDLGGRALRRLLVARHQPPPGRHRGASATSSSATV